MDGHAIGGNVQIDPIPVFRKTIVPWYDSESVCLLVIVLMLPVFWFGSIGAMVAREEALYHDHLGVPVLLMILSAVVIISTTARLVVRFFRRLSN